MDATPTHISRTRVVARVAVFWVAYAAILVAASFAKGMIPERWGQLVWGLLSSIALLTLTFFLLARERRTARDVGLAAAGNRLVRFVGGAATGVAAYAFILLCISTFVGRIHFTRVTAPDADIITLTVATFLALALMEELGFRGYPLRTLAPVLGPWPAQLIVAAAFCLSHIAFGWSWQAVAMGVFPSAVLFGVVAIGSGDLLVAIAVHAGMNLAQWGVGEDRASGFWSMSLSERAPDAAAVLAPLVGLLATLVFAAAAWAWYSRKHRNLQDA